MTEGERLVWAAVYAAALDILRNVDIVESWGKLPKSERDGAYKLLALNAVLLADEAVQMMAASQKELENHGKYDSRAYARLMEMRLK